jgi:hypothetical protein
MVGKRGTIHSFRTVVQPRPLVGIFCATTSLAVRCQSRVRATCSSWIARSCGPCAVLWGANLMACAQRLRRSSASRCCRAPTSRAASAGAAPLPWQPTQRNVSTGTLEPHGSVVVAARTPRARLGRQLLPFGVPKILHAELLSSRNPAAMSSRNPAAVVWTTWTMWKSPPTATM